MNPRESADFIVKFSKNVFLHQETLRHLSIQLLNFWEKEPSAINSLESDEVFKNLKESDVVNCLFLLSALHFCFWAKNKHKPWLVEFNGRTYSGFFALKASVGKSIQNGLNIYDPLIYSKFELDDILKIFQGRGNVNINLPKERLKCLRESGKILLDKYNGQFLNCVLEANKSAKVLLELIVKMFPCFNDTALYHKEIVSFHKRAQILIADIWMLNEGLGISEFHDIDYLTMFADYRVPQVLMHFGVITYSESLLTKLKNDKILENGSEEEIEIRGCSIKAVELLLADFNALLNDHNNQKEEYKLNAILIDKYLWNYRRNNSNKLKSIPFHKVYSIYY